MPSIIQQIADELNVSGASVSRALNDRPGVGAELRERILEKAREFNYTPTITGRGLATSQTFGIGFFVREKPGLSAQTDPFYGEILRGAEQTLAQSDYHLTLATLTSDILNAPEAFRFTRERRIDGMILAGPDIPNDFIMAMLRTRVPLVLVDNRLENSPVDCINVDDEGGAYAAIQHLINLGHTEIGVIAGPEHWASNARRVRGYRRGLDEAGLTLHEVHMSQTTIESGEEAYRQIVTQYPQVTAIAAVNDSMAIGAIRAARARGRNVPDDLSVAGFDDIAWAQLNDPPLTTVRIPKSQIGQEAVQRLLSLLDNPQLLPAEIAVSVQLIERNSTRRR